MFERKLGKVITYSLAPEEGEEALYYLTFRQARALISTLEYFRWMNRHRTLPDDINTVDKMDEWVSDLEKRLMREVTPENMSCDDVADCIDNDDELKDRLSQEALDYLLEHPDKLDELFNALRPLIAEEISKVLNPSDDCDHDVLWAQCLAVARYTHTTVIDLLEVIEVQSNQVELLVNTAKVIPFMKAAFAVVPIDSALEFAGWLQDTVKEQYDANWDDSDTPDGTAWKIAEELFCLCEDDCEITLQDIWNAYDNLLSGVTSISWENAVDFIESIVGVNDNSLLLVYATHAMLWGVVKLFRFFGRDTYDAQILSLVLKLAIDDASNDWEGIVDCVTVDYCEDATHSYDFKVSNQTWHAAYPPIPDYYGIYHVGQGWGVGSGGFNIAIDKDLSSETVVKGKLFLNKEAVGSPYIKTTYENGLTNLATPSATGTEGDTYWYEFGPISTNLGIGFLYYTSDPDARIVRACIWTE